MASDFNAVSLQGSHAAVQTLHEAPPEIPLCTCILSSYSWPSPIFSPYPLQKSRCPELFISGSLSFCTQTTTLVSLGIHRAGSFSDVGGES